jgi:hypothetical protein
VVSGRFLPSGYWMPRITQARSEPSNHNTKQLMRGWKRFVRHQRSVSIVKLPTQRPERPQHKT